DVASPEGFERDPALVLRFYNQRRLQLHDPALMPNAAHQALARLEDAFGERFLLVTQNVDNLHERAGSKRIVHMHGELLKARCLRSERVIEWQGDLTQEDRCACCASPAPLRPHIVWFGETPLDMERIYQALAASDLFLSIGTSGHVYPAAGFVEVARQCGAKTVELNLEESLRGSSFHETIHAPATQAVPAYVEQLLAQFG
ncbi:MAG: NAD-dependent protein deacylase, partial [Zoogloeaceae bacterium]|nr:NAD-dependent protein deacylase [Zoogloeaceae bacterium]